MEYSIEREKSTVSFKFICNGDEWNEAVSKAYQKTKGQYNVPGFRKGKAPRNMIEKMYGSSVFTDDAMDIIINDNYVSALEEHPEIDPIDRPEVGIDAFDGNELKFTIKVSVKPDIKLGDYKGIKLPKIEYNVSEADVEGKIKLALEKSARTVEVDRASQAGDIINIDYSGSVDGVKFDGGAAEGYDLTLGSNTFIPGFEDQLIGCKKGDEKDVKVTFPEEYHAENLKGKEAIFACKVNSVSAKELPAEDDKWAAEVSEHETLAAYKAGIKEKLTAENERRIKAERENAVINAIVDGAECEVPQCLVDAYLEDMLKDIEMRLYYQGLKIEDYFKYTGSSAEQFKSEKHDEAVRGALTRLCLEEITKLEKITVTDEEAEAKYREMYPETKNERKAPTGRDLGYIKSNIATERLLEFLVNSVNWTEGTEGGEEPKAKKPAPKKAKASVTEKTATE